ncbi:MAG: hypothetical protein D8H97_27220 [Neisseria sp.]|nr:MAG: hypothetical protein D8H97_27220 [Neisseria sp.]
MKNYIKYMLIAIGFPSTILTAIQFFPHINNKQIAFILISILIISAIIILYLCITYKSNCWWKKFLMNDNSLKWLVSSPKIYKSPIIHMVIAFFIVVLIFYLVLQYTFDPKKELAKSGISWSSDSMLKSAQENDLNSLELFLQGGMPINISLAKNILMDGNRDEVNLLVKYSYLFNPKNCVKLFEQDMNIEDQKIIILREYSQLITHKLCGNDVGRSIINNNLKIERDNYNSAVNEYNRQLRELEKRRVSADECIKNELSNNAEKLLRDAAMFDLKSSSRIDGRNELLAQIKIRMITDYDLNHGLGVDNFISEIEPFIKKYCEKQVNEMPNINIDDHYFKFWQTISDWASNP